VSKYFNNKGYISEIALLTILLLFIMIESLSTDSYLESQVLNANINSEKAYYSVEDTLNLVLNDESCYNDFKSKIFDFLKSKKYNSIEDDIKYGKVYYVGDINIDKNYINDSIKKLKVYLYQKDEIFKGIVTATGTYQGDIKKSAEGVYTIINPIYIGENPIISSNDIGKDSLNSITELVNGFPFFGLDGKQNLIDTSDYDNVEISLSDFNANGFDVSCYRYGNDCPAKKSQICGEEIFFVKKSNNHGMNSNVCIKSNNSDVNTQNVLSGILYVEGDLEICSNAKFNGIIVVNGGNIIVNSDVKPSIDGLIILNDYSGDEALLKKSIDIKYNEEIVKKYGIYLKNFIKPKLESIKEIMN